MAFSGGWLLGSYAYICPDERSGWHHSSFTKAPNIALQIIACELMIPLPRFSINRMIELSVGVAS